MDACFCSCESGEVKEPIDGYKWVLVPSDAIRLPGQVEPDEVTESTETLADLNSEVSYSFMDSLIYVMIPSLLSFFIIFFAFYLLHSFTDDEKRRTAFYAKINKNCNSLKKHFQSAKGEELESQKGYPNGVTVENAKIAEAVN